MIYLAIVCTFVLHFFSSIVLQIRDFTQIKKTQNLHFNQASWDHYSKLERSSVCPKFYWVGVSGKSRTATITNQSEDTSMRKLLIVTHTQRARKGKKAQ